MIKNLVTISDKKQPKQIYKFTEAIVFPDNMEKRAKTINYSYANIKAVSTSFLL